MGEAVLTPSAVRKARHRPVRRCSRLRSVLPTPWLPSDRVGLPWTSPRRRASCWDRRAGHRHRCWGTAGCGTSGCAARSTTRRPAGPAGSASAGHSRGQGRVERGLHLCLVDPQFGGQCRGQLRGVELLTRAGSLTGDRLTGVGVGGRRRAGGEAEGGCDRQDPATDHGGKPPLGVHLVPFWCEVTPTNQARLGTGSRCPERVLCNLA